MHKHSHTHTCTHARAHAHTTRWGRESKGGARSFERCLASPAPSLPRRKRGQPARVAMAPRRLRIIAGHQLDKRGHTLRKAERLPSGRLLDMIPTARCCSPRGMIKVRVCVCGCTIDVVDGGHVQRAACSTQTPVVVRHAQRAPRFHQVVPGSLFHQSPSPSPSSSTPSPSPSLSIDFISAISISIKSFNRPRRPIPALALTVSLYLYLSLLTTYSLPLPRSALFSLPLQISLALSRPLSLSLSHSLSPVTRLSLPLHCL